MWPTRFYSLTAQEKTDMCVGLCQDSRSAATLAALWGGTSTSCMCKISNAENANWGMLTRAECLVCYCYCNASMLTSLIVTEHKVKSWWECNSFEVFRQKAKKSQLCPDAGCNTIHLTLWNQAGASWLTAELAALLSGIFQLHFEQWEKMEVSRPSSFLSVGARWKVKIIKIQPLGSMIVCTIFPSNPLHIWYFSGDWRGGLTNTVHG